MTIDADLHIHTKYSFDSLLEPKTIIKLALKRGLSAISITDHDTTKGGLAVKKEASSKSKDLIVISGIEVKTDRGDVVGLYVEDEIKAEEFHEVVEEIRRQDGLVVLPHPYNRHSGVEELVSHVDLVEALNGRSSRVKNDKALKLANVFDKPVVACSDAHFSFEIGRARTRFHTEACSPQEFRKLVVYGDRELVGRESSFIVHGFSFAVGIVKRLVGL